MISQDFVETRLNNSAGDYMFKVNNRNTKTRYEISKLTIKTIEQRQYFTPRSSISVANFEQVNVS